MSMEFRSKQEAIQRQMSGLNNADENYYVTAKYILDVSRRAHELLQGSELVQKRQLLKLVLQNLEIYGRILRQKISYPLADLYKYTNVINGSPYMTRFDTLNKN